MKNLSCAAVFIIGAFCLAQPAKADNAAQQFAKANQEYASGNYQQAVESYKGLVEAKQWNASLFYNLGNAWFRLGDRGKAILEYERALALDRDHPEAQANLRLVRDDARALELPKSAIDRYLAFASPSQYAWAAAVAFWIAMFALAGFVASRRRSQTRAAILIVAVLVLCGALCALYQVENGPTGRSLAIVLGKNVEARLATADNARAVLALPAGSEIKIVSKRGDWFYAALPNNLRGWIPANSAEMVRL